jgi:hypothetical protein
MKIFFSTAILVLAVSANSIGARQGTLELDNGSSVQLTRLYSKEDPTLRKRALSCWGAMRPTSKSTSLR